MKLKYPKGCFCMFPILLHTLQTCQWRGLARMAHLLFGMDRPTYHVIQLNIILDLLISASYFPIFTL